MRKNKLNKIKIFLNILNTMSKITISNVIFPYFILFLFAFFIICCFVQNCYGGMTARELRQIRERHEEEMRQNDIRLARQIQSLRQQENEELEETFIRANIDRLELADSLERYAKYLKTKMERERIEEEEDIVIFINPGNENPVLGRLMVD